MMSQEMNMSEKKTPLKQFDADEITVKPSQEPTYGTFDKTTTTTTTTTPDSELHKPTVLEKVKGVFSSNKDAKDSEFSDQNKPGVLQGAKEMVWHGVEKAKGVFSSAPKELHPGNGYHWKKVTTEQGQTHWIATDDWSGGGFLEGAKSWAKGVFSSNKDAKDSEVIEDKQEVVAAEEQKPSALQGAKEKFWHGVEKGKGMFTSTKNDRTTPW